jgi:formylglycine-generating enzyme required for sulfatase activity
VDQKDADQQRMEAILKEYADLKVREWDQARNDPDDPDGLTHYTERHYSVLPAGTGYDKAHETPRNAFQPIKADGEDALVRLLQQGRLLCVAEDAGMGKTIFARRLQAFLCSGAASKALGTSGPLAAVYCASDWPTNAAEGVALELRDTLGAQAPTAEAVAQWAVDSERVVLILDALDQVPEAQRENLVRLERFLHSQQGAKCRVVITTRFAEVPESYKLLFERLKWRFALIEGCNEAEQATILGETLYHRLDELIPDRKDVADLLCFPVVLFMIRQLAKDGQLAPFKNRADLYSRATYHMLKEAAPKSRFRFPSDHPLSLQDIPRYEEILARIAFVMMCQGKYDYVVKDPKAAYQIRQQIRELCGDEIDHASWRMIEIFTDCTNRCILEDVKTTWFGWKHRGMMEYYGGLFLAKYAKPENEALLRPFANDPQWNWAWRFAIELPRGVPRVETWSRSLGLLFEKPASGSRPTELMYRAWPALLQAAKYLTSDDWEDRDLFAATIRAQEEAWERVAEQRDLVDSNPARELVLRFLGEFPKMCAAHSSADGEIARQLTPDGSHTRLLWDGTSDPAKLKPGKIRNFIKCASGKYMMGAGDNDRDASSGEKPRHQVELSEFLVQTTAVTVGQYRLFDPRHNCPGSDDCPVTKVSWYDAWVFALWVGGLLPTEAQWEYACRAGTTTPYSFAGGAEQLGKYAWYHENSGGEAHPVATRLANPLGLYDMHGNVWEWCWDWYGEYEGTEAENPTGPLGGSIRVYRGGGWGDDASDCRSALRDGVVVPGIRWGFFGFRLARAVSLCPAR